MFLVMGLTKEKGKDGLIGFMPAYETREQAEDAFPDMEVIELQMHIGILKESE